MAADFEVYGRALGLNSCCLYGGAPMQAQQNQLKRGVDIVVGTPGRIKVCYPPKFLQVSQFGLLVLNYFGVFVYYPTGSHREGKY